MGKLKNLEKVCEKGDSYELIDSLLFLFKFRNPLSMCLN